MLPRPLRFGISRSHGGADPLASGRLLVAALGAQLGVRVELRVAADYDDLTEQLINGAIHVAWMAPLAHAHAAGRGAMLAVVSERGGALTYRSALLVRRDSPFIGVGGLRGVRAAWTDPASASGHLWARLHLLVAGVDPKRDFAEEKFWGSSAAALGAVVSGEADLCACYTRQDAASEHDLALADAERLCAGAGERLRVLDVTDEIPPDGVVLAPQLDPEDQARLRDLLLDLHTLPGGPEALKSLMQADRLRGVTAEVEKIVQRLRAHVPLRRT